ncbi:MAG TPA: ATP-binding protein [Ktedonobacteraceae bacterium]|nr:ATP-binding protein [Ktedonobacteraceae bacterium]
MLNATDRRAQFKPVGITKGPGENAHEYTFVSRDDDQVLKNGEYVYYELEQVENEEQSQNGAGKAVPARRVLGRIIRRLPLQLYPDTFLAEPEIPPSQVAAMVGYDARANELFELHVAIMGYYDAPTASFINPWIPPQSGKQIFLADDEMLANILSRKRTGQPGSATIGSLLTRAPDAVPIVLSVKDLVSTHLAIIASTGAGKSYLASVIIEELMRPHNKACVLIIDPHGEYGTLDQIANFPQFSEQNDGLHTGRLNASPADVNDARRGLSGAERSAFQSSVPTADLSAPRGASYSAQVKVYKPEQVKVRISTLDMGDMRHLLTEMTEKQQYLLNRALRKVKEDKKGTPWGANDLKNAIKAVSKQKGDEDSDGADDSSTVHALTWRIEQRFVNSFTFDDMQHLDLPEIFKPGQCTVLQLNEIDERDQQVIVATLLRRLNKARMDTERGKVHSGESYLPYPVFVLLEEAHHFAPGGTEVVSTSILKQVLAEGRKFGIGVGLISQRPGKLDPDVLSQCQTQCIMRIVNEIDQKSVAAAIEGVGRDLLDNLPALSKGQVIIAGAAVNTPVICRVGPRITRHGGESKDAPDMWQQFFSSEAQQKRHRSEAPLNGNKGFDLYR